MKQKQQNQQSLKPFNNKGFESTHTHRNTAFYKCLLILNFTLLLNFMAMQKSNAQDVAWTSLANVFPTSTESHGKSMLQTADGNFIACVSIGSTQKNILVVRNNKIIDNLKFSTTKL